VPNETLVVSASVFFFVRWFVGCFRHEVGQAQSFASFGLCIGFLQGRDRLCSMPMCVAVGLAIFFPPLSIL
jgi:hypothetical protein